MEPLMIPIIGATLASATFTVMFGVRSKWYTSPVGKMQFQKSLTLTAVLILILINNWVKSDYPFRETIRYIVYYALTLALVKQVRTLWMVQKGKIQGPIYGRRHDDVKDENNVTSL